MFYFLLVVAVMIGSAAQVLIKAELTSVAMQTERTGLLLLAIELLTRPLLVLAGVMLIAAAGLWYYAVSHLPLSRAFLFAALSYPMVIAGSALFLGEPVTIAHVAGCALIMCGITVISFA